MEKEIEDYILKIFKDNEVQVTDSKTMPYCILEEDFIGISKQIANFISLNFSVIKSVCEHDWTWTGSNGSQSIYKCTKCRMETSQTVL